MMSEEAKEILDDLRNINNYDYSEICDNENNIIEKEYDIYLSKNKTDLLLDYITNLQEENERLNTELNAYKSRCEKANEYIKENKDKYYHDWGEDDGSYDTYLDETEIDKLSNILNGGDE